MERPKHIIDGGMFGLEEVVDRIIYPKIGKPKMSQTIYIKCPDELADWIETQIAPDSTNDTARGRSKSNFIVFAIRQLHQSTPTPKPPGDEER